MRKVAVLLLIIALVSIQATMAKGSEYGVRAGWQSAMFKYSDGKTDAISSFYIGAFREGKIIPFLDYGLGLEYAQMGGKESNEEYKLGYIGVPLYLKANVGPLYGLVGSGINFKISESDASVYNNEANTIDVPVYVGVGLSFLMLSAEVRYHWGLIEIQNTIKNQYLQLGLALRF